MFYVAFVRRQAIEEITLRKIIMVATMSAALYANTNLDSSENKGIRERMISELNENMEQRMDDALAAIYRSGPAPEEVAEATDPFLTSMDLPYESNGNGGELA